MRWYVVVARVCCESCTFEHGHGVTCVRGYDDRVCQSTVFIGWLVGMLLLLGCVVRVVPLNMDMG